MADSFDGVTIVVSNTNAAIPEESALVFSERIIPGGTTSYLDIAGKQLPRLTLGLYFSTGAAYESFKAKVGVQGTLIYVVGTFTALMVSLTRTKRNVTTAGETWADASFREIV